MFPGESNAHTLQKAAVKKLDELSSESHIANSIEPIFLTEGCSNEHHSTSDKPSTSSTRCSLEPDYKPDSSDSDSDSDASELVPDYVPGTPELYSRNKRFEKFERRRAIMYFEHQGITPNMLTVEKYLRIDQYISNRVDFCLAKYHSTLNRLRHFRTMLAQWYQHRKSDVVRHLFK